MENNVFNNIISSIEKKAQQNADVNKEDYIGNDGLIYCGKCKTPKQCKLNNWLGKNVEHTVFIQCKCQKEEEERIKDREKRHKEQKIIETIRNKSLMDEKFLSSTFESSDEIKDNKKQIEIAKKYTQKFDYLYQKNQGLLLWGNLGTGKTHIACCIGNKLIENRKTVYATSLVKILEKQFNKSELSKIIDNMNVAQLLILDDLGAERNTEYAQEVVYNIIDSRYRSKKPMIITTNLLLEEMKNERNLKLKRIYDRIFEVCYPVMFNGQSLRMKEAAKRFDNMKKFLED